MPDQGSQYPTPSFVRLLQLAAEEWVAQHEEALRDEDYYSTSQNQFLWDAESEYFAAVEG